LQSVSYTISNHKIKTLDRLAGSALAKVILGTLDNNSSSARIMMPTDVKVV
jgi:hypothetical protein